MNKRKLIYDLVGLKYGRLTVLSEAGINPKTRQRLWNCICECGGIKTTNQYSLINGYCNSCGCIHKEKMKGRIIKHGLTIDNKKPDGYQVWSSMRDRCYNEKNPSFKNYGGKGIVVCDRWNNSFLNFINDMGQRLDKSYTLDRIDSNKGYFPENCRWAKWEVQNNNRVNNVWISHNGEKKTLSQWERHLGMSHNTLRGHLLRKSFETVYNEKVHYIISK